MKKSLLLTLLLAFLLPWALQAEILTFNFEDGQIPEGWTTDATYPWISATEDPNQTQINCIKSGNSGVSSSSSTITTTFTFAGDGSISFRGGCWGEGTSSAWDQCIFSIDGSSKFANGALQSWNEYSYNLEAGEHTFTWTFSKDGSVNAAGDAFYIDDVVVDLGSASAPKKPTDLSCTGVTTTTATLSWTEAGSATAWEIVLNDNESNLIVANTNPFTVQNLTASTTYSAKVRATNGSEYSAWSSSVNFTTECSAISNFPWSENFESYSSGDFVAPCWVNEHISGSGTYIFKIYTSTNGGNSTHQLQLPDMNSGTMTKLVLPEMTLPANYQFVLDVYRNTSSSSYEEEGIRVFASTDGEIEGATELAFISRNYTISDNHLIPAEEASGWYTYELPIGKSGTCYIIIRGESKWGAPTYMDNFSVEAMPSCLKPTDLAVNSISTNSADLSWTANSGEAAWKLYYKKASEENFTEVDNVSENHYTLNGLETATAYQFYVKAICGASEESEASAIANFATDCDAIATLPWNENFDGYAGSSSSSVPSGYPDDELPNCWQFLNRSERTSSYPQVFISSISDYPVSGNCLFFKSSSTTPLYAVLPEFAQDIADLQLTFTYRNEGTSGSNGTLYAGYMTDPTDSTTFVSVLSCPRTTTRTEKDVLFSDAPKGSFIAFKYAGGTADNYYLSIDNVIVAPIPTCLKPSALSYDYGSLKAHSVQLAWTNGEEGQNAWEIAYSKLSNFNPDEQVSDSIVAANSNPFVLSGLKQSTTYYAYVRANCGAQDGVSLWNSSKVSFSTISGHQVLSSLALVDGSLGSQGAEVNWNPNAYNELHASYEIYYSQLSTLPASEEELSDDSLIQNISDTFYVFSNLTPETQYYVWVRDSCAADGLSAWSSRASFTTLANCAVPFNLAASEISAHEATIAWEGNNDSYSVQYRTASIPGTIILNEGFEDGSMPEGWSATSTYWNVGSGTGNSSYTGAATGNYNATCYINKGSSTSDILVTPAMDLSAASAAKLSFNYRNVAWSSDIDELHVYYRVNEGDWQSLYENLAAQSAWTTTPITIELTGLAANYQIGFKCTTGSGSYNYGYGMGIDDVLVYEIEDAGQWQSVSSNVKSKQISGLAPETKYDVQVLGICGAITTDPSEIISFTTLPSCLPVSGLAVDNITTSGADITWIAGDAGQTDWQISLNDDIIDVNSYPFTLTGLADATAYSVKVRANCGSGDYSEWSEKVDFVTPQLAVGLPFNEDFESDNKWLFVNGDLENAWVIGNATNNGGTKALYISNDDGVSNEYTVNSSTMVYATKLFNFEAGKYAFSYDWKAKGEAGYSIYDYLRVALVPSTVELSAATSTPSGFTPSGLPSGWIALDGGEALVDEDSWQKKEVVIDVPVAGAYKMVLAWRNDYSGGSQPPAAIDNVHIVKVDSIYVNDSRYATFYTENYAYIMPEGLTGYAFTVESHLSDAIYEADDIVPANAALVLESAKGDTTYWPVPTFVDVPNMSVTNDLHGVNEATIIGSATDGKAYYVLSLNGASEPESVGFYWMLEDGKGGFELPAHKAYLVVDNPSSAPAAFFLFNGENGATWLDNLQGVEGTVKFMHEGNIYILRDSIIYDATGRKVRELK